MTLLAERPTAYSIVDAQDALREMADRVDREAVLGWRPSSPMRRRGKLVAAILREWADDLAPEMHRRLRGDS